MIKNILFVIDTLNRSGGTERYVSEHGKLLADKFNVSVLTIDNSFESYFNIDDKVKRVTTKKKYKRHKLDSIFQKKKFINEVKDLLVTMDDYTLILPVGLRVNYFFLKHQTKFKKAKVVICEHLSFDDARVHRVGKKITALLKPETHIIAQTKKSIEQYSKISKNVHLIYNFIEEKLKNKRVENLKNRVKIVLVGALKTHKRPHKALEFCRILKYKEIDFTLFIYGDDLEKAGFKSYKAKIKNLIKKYDLSNNVIFYKSEKSVEKIYGDKDFLLITSKSESFPYTIVEAKAYGLPVLSYPFQGSPEEFIQEGEDGKISDRTEDLVDKLVELTSDIKRYQSYSEKAKKWVKDLCEKNVVLNQWDECIDSINFKLNGDRRDQFELQ